ncbi:MAG: PDZ domain-containing protein [Planctomycetes bacterium]|nr:PDZ domain-containing protein [Planctomycetota bacterium]
MRKLTRLAGALLLTLAAAPAAWAQEPSEQDLQARREIRERILRKVDERLASEVKRIHDEVARLLDEELGLAQGKGETPIPATAAADAEARRERIRKHMESVRRAIDGTHPGEVRERLEEAHKAAEELRRQAAARAHEAAARAHEEAAAAKRGAEAKTGHEVPPAGAATKPAGKSPWLGVQLGQPEAESDEDEAAGVPIAALVPGGPAAQAGLKEGDVIVKIGTQAVKDAPALIEAVTSHKVGAKVQVTFQRGDQERTLTVTLGARPSPLDEASDEPADEDADEEAEEHPAEKPAAVAPPAEHPAGASPHHRTAGGGQVLISFDDAKAGTLPDAVACFVTGRGPAGQWEIKADPSAPSAPNVLAQTSTDDTDYRFPVLVCKDHVFADIDLAVKFKAVSGKVDQAAGLVFRLRDANNYYVVRANSLENNLRLYKVEDGRRRQFAGADFEVKSGVWHDLRVSVKGDRFEVWLDGTSRIKAQDGTFDKGLCGLWTKADSVTYFDDIKIGYSSPTPGAAAAAAPAEKPAPKAPAVAKQPDADEDEDAEEAMEEEEEESGDEPSAELHDAFDAALKLHTEKKFKEAIAGFKQVVAGAKGSSLGVTAEYNVACGYALLGKKDEAFSWLERAVDHGFIRAAEIRTDEDFAGIRNDPRFEQILKKAEGARSRFFNEPEDEDTDEPETQEKHK